MKIVPFFAFSLSLTLLSHADAHTQKSASPGIRSSATTSPGPASPVAPASPNLTMYGRGLYPGADSIFDDLRLSGFNTIEYWRALMNGSK